MECYEHYATDIYGELRAGQSSLLVLMVFSASMALGLEVRVKHYFPLCPRRLLLCLRKYIRSLQHTLLHGN